MRKRVLHAWLLLGTLFTLAQSASAATSNPRLQMDLTPTFSADGSADGVAVKYVATGIQSGQTLSLAFDAMPTPLVRTTDVVTDLQVSDASGALSMNAPVKKHDGSHDYQVWVSSRAANGAVTVSYRVPVASRDRKRGPQEDLQQAGKGISGAYISFLLLPMLPDAHYDAQVHWHMREGERAVTSYGVNDYRGTFTAGTFGDTLFLAGKVLEFSPEKSGPDHGMHIYTLGMPADDFADLGQWAAKAYAAERAAFKTKGDLPYRFMVRSFDGGGTYSGRGGHSSFLLYMRPGYDAGDKALRRVVAHEMVHSLTGMLRGDSADDSDDWYAEGIADYFSLVIPYSAGLYTHQEYLDLVRKESDAYYSSPDRSIPNSAIADVMWRSPKGWLIPYTRGTLYFADLNAKLEQHGLKIGAIDLVNELSDIVESGKTTSADTWVDILRRRAGAWAVTDWQAMMAGSVIFPAPNAFGACLRGARSDIVAGEQGSHVAGMAWKLDCGAAGDAH